MSFAAGVVSRAKTAPRVFRFNYDYDGRYVDAFNKREFPSLRFLYRSETRGKVDSKPIKLQLTF